MNLGNWGDLKDTPRARHQVGCALVVVLLTTSGCTQQGARIRGTASSPKPSVIQQTVEASPLPSLPPMPTFRPRAGVRAPTLHPRWRMLPSSPLKSRSGMVSVWTGTQWIIWGGGYPYAEYADGATYDPRTRRWRMIPPSPLEGRSAATAVWTGREMIISGSAGGNVYDADGNLVEEGKVYSDGAAYNPRTRSWRRLALSPLSPRSNAVSVWTGTVMLVSGGSGAETGADGSSARPNRWAAYDPRTDRWTAIATPRMDASLSANGRAVWTGTEMIVSANTGAGFAYNPARDRWRTLAPAGVAPDVWTGSRLVMMGGRASGPNLAGPSSVTTYDPVTNEWLRFPPGPIPSFKGEFASAWTGSHVLVWADSDREAPPCDLMPCEAGQGTAALHLASGRWTPLPGAPIKGRDLPAVAWTGKELLVWGGEYDGDYRYDDGASLAI